MLSPEMRIVGADQLAKNLAEFGPRTVRTVLKPALRSGARVIASAQRKAVPRGQRDVRAAIGSRGVKGNSRLLRAKAGGGVGKPRIAKLQTGEREARRGRNQREQYPLVSAGDRPALDRRENVGRQKPQREPPQAGVVQHRKSAPEPREDARPQVPARRRRAQGPANFAMRSAIAKGISREWKKRQLKQGSRY